MPPAPQAGSSIPGKRPAPPSSRRLAAVRTAKEKRRRTLLRLFKRWGGTGLSCYCQRVSGYCCRPGLKQLSAPLPRTPCLSHKSRPTGLFGDPFQSLGIMGAWKGHCPESQDDGFLPVRPLTSAVAWGHHVSAPGLSFSIRIIRGLAPEGGPCALTLSWPQARP